MIKIIFRLSPFFEDNYEKINVRKYARMLNISPPTASKFLKEMVDLGLLISNIDKGYLLFRANRENKTFKDLQNIYWFEYFKDSGLLDFLKKELINPTIVLFGSLSKCEATKNSDIDLALFTKLKKKINISLYEKKLKRKIQLIIFPNRDNIENRNLFNNVINGYVLEGKL